MHGLNLHGRRLHLLTLLKLLARLLALVHSLDFRRRRLHLLVLQHVRHRRPHQPAHRGAKLLCVRRARLRGRQALVVQLCELREVEPAVAVGVVVLHQGVRERREFLVSANVQAKLVKDIQELTPLEAAGGVGIELIERRLHVRVRHLARR